MNVRDMLVLLEYGYWENERLLDLVEKLTPEQLHVAATLSHGTVFDLVRHMLDTEWSWRMFASGGEGTKYLWEVEDVSDLLAIRRFWRQERGRMLAYINGLAEADLEHDVDYGTAQGGKPRLAKRWHILMHIVNHGTHHRSELNHYLSEHGYPVEDLSLLDFVRLPIRAS